MIIAEIGGNHNGDLTKAMNLIHLAKQAGVDAVKFQIYKAETLVTPNMPGLPQSKSKTQFERFKSLEFSHPQWLNIIRECQGLGVRFMATCFDLGLLDKYQEYMDVIKVSSGDLTYVPLLKQAASYGKPVYLSTGMSTFHEIEQAAQWIPRAQLTVLQCVSTYPCPDEEANLGVIRTLQERYRVGYSDHTIGITACLAAAGMGVEVIEKHFTDDKTQEIGDHRCSADPEDMACLVNEVKRIKKMMGEEKPAKSEYTNKNLMRRGAYAMNPIKKNQVIRPEDIQGLRPVTRQRPHEVVGQKAHDDYEVGDAINS